MYGLAAATLVVACAGCRVSLTHQPLPHTRNIGFLNGVKPDTPNEAIVQLAPHVVRLPSVAPPYWSAQAARLAEDTTRGGLGVRTLQLILGPQILETRSPLNSSALTKACWPQLTPQCPLPGTAADPDYTQWEAAIADTLDQVHKQGLADKVVYDIWNEPNFVGGPGGGGGGWPFSSQWYTPPAGRPAYTEFYEVWNRAVRLIRAAQPNATIVGPSAAPGPGLPEGSAEGWLPQQQWLREFITQAAANFTMPDLLSWHDYTGQPSMASSMQAELRAWMGQQPGLGPALAATIPMGYNEVVDSRHAQSAGYHIAMATALDRCEPAVDHAALGCWAEPASIPGTGSASTCWDGSLDGLLDPAANFSARPAWHALRWYAGLPGDARVQLAVSAGAGGGADSASAGGSCMLDGVAAQLPTGSLVVLLGRWGAPRSTATATATARSRSSTFGSMGGDSVTVALGVSHVARCVRVQRLTACTNLTVACAAATPSADPPVALAPNSAGELLVDIAEAEAVRLEVTQALGACE